MDVIILTVALALALFYLFGGVTDDSGAAGGGVVDNAVDMAGADAQIGR